MPSRSRSSIKHRYPKKRQPAGLSTERSIKTQDPVQEHRFTLSRLVYNTTGAASLIYGNQRHYNGFRIDRGRCTRLMSACGTPGLLVSMIVLPHPMSRPISITVVSQRDEADASRLTHHEVPSCASTQRELGWLHKPLASQRSGTLSITVGFPEEAPLATTYCNGVII